MGPEKLTKLEVFEEGLKKRVLDGRIRNNSEALLFAYSKGHLGAQADAVLRSLKMSNLISYEGNSPLITYENVFKLKKIISYTIK